MKIERLTDNKIRVIITSKDLDFEYQDLNSFMTKTLETQELFFKILSKAEKEVGFNTSGCKLLIEISSSVDDYLIFTITKTTKKTINSSASNNKEKKLVIRKKSTIPNKDFAIYRFDNFDQFCELCNYLHNISNVNIDKFSKNSLLYLYNDTYYLIVEKINSSIQYITNISFALSEFGDLLSNSSYFKDKIIEHGKIIMKENAIITCISFFVR